MATRDLSGFGGDEAPAPDGARNDRPPTRAAGEARSPRPAIPASLPAVPVEALRLYAAHPAVYLGLAFVFLAPAYVALGSAAGQPMEYVAGLAAGGPAVATACAVLGTIPAVLGGSVVIGCLYVAFSAVLASAVFLDGGGRRPSMWQAARAALARLRPLAGGSLLGVVVVVLALGVPLAGLGLAQGCFQVAVSSAAAGETGQAAGPAPGPTLAWAALLLAGVGYVALVAVRWVLIPQIAVLEGGTSATVLLRSDRLVRGRWAATALVLLALVALQALVSWLVALPLTPLANVLGGSAGDVARAAVQVVAQVAGLPVGTLGTTALYLRLRHEREGFGPADLDREAADLLPGRRPRPGTTSA